MATHTHHDHASADAGANAESAVPLLEAASSASVMLDIGAGLGALVILPSERFRGREIEISRLDSDALRTHTGVHMRSTKRTTRLTAIFGSLPAGEYVIWEDADTAGPVVEVPDGAVAEIRLD